MLSEVNAHIVARGQPTLAGRFVREPFTGTRSGLGWTETAGHRWVPNLA